MIFKKKIPCYVLLFEQTEIIKRTLTFLSAYTSTIDIILVENPSVNSPEIKKFVDSLGDRGLIKRHYLLGQNITGNALGVIIDKEKEFIRKAKYVIVTDGDIESKDKVWLDEEKQILKKHRDVFTCGISLEMSNLPLETFPESKDWLPPDINEHADFFEAFTGAHLLLFRSNELLHFMDWKKDNDLSFVDGNLHKFCTDVLHKKWARTKLTSALHLTWDLYHDRNHPYTQFKLGKSFQQTWYHSKTADYIVTEY